jgi:hypothetical protein
MPKPVCLFPPHLIDDARRAHLRGATQYEVSRILGCSQQTAGRRIRDWGWGPSRLRGHRPAPPALHFAPLPAPDEGGDEPTDLRHSALAARLKRLVAREMKRTEICGGAPLEVARTLASLGQTLKLLSGLPADEAENDGQLAEDVAAVTQNIARRLNELVAETDARNAALEAEEFSVGGDANERTPEPAVASFPRIG